MRRLLASSTALLLLLTLAGSASGAPAAEEGGGLVADLTVASAAHGLGHAAGQPVEVRGQLRRSDGTVRALAGTPFSLRLRTADGELRGPFGPFRSDARGAFRATLPGEATAGLDAGPETGYVTRPAVEVLDAEGQVVGQNAVQVVAAQAPDSVYVESKFVSSVGWVKPGETYPFRVLVHNPTSNAETGAVVEIALPAGTTFIETETLGGAGTATINGDGSITWNVGAVPAATGETPTILTLVIGARAHTVTQDPRIVWKDLSVTATLQYDGYAGPALTSMSHGPKVIPTNGGFETARYGDKPFPVVPVDYLDRKHDESHSGDLLAEVINSPDIPGSTWNLYQEMSYGQLYPIGTVPSAGIATADWDYAPGFEFTSTDPLRIPTCRGATLGAPVPAYGPPLLPERIVDGWYQLPGTTEYYGGDYPIFSLGVGSTIDGACGETSKSVYDAAVISDPEIDYSDYDSDKDGVVDFFMMVFVGIGGNGASQTGGGYDNIWPHSSSLEFSYQDPETGLAGYISDDQLKSLEGIPQCFLDDSYGAFDDCGANGGEGDDALPVPVRVGPYNVNPEDAIDAASVISHEYGHHLGLPDFYSNDYEAYGTLNLMAADYSQHMTVFAKQDMGWVVPHFLQPGETVEVEDWEEIKNDTGEIAWETPDGEPYVLSAANGDQNIHNGASFSLKLPRDLVIDPEQVASEASSPWVWWSGRGNDFGCAPQAGHNLDIRLPELEDVPAGSQVTLSFKSSWDIEWDWDYGFVQVTTDGKDYTTLMSQELYSTPSAYNPNNISCLDANDNGLTGQSGSWGQSPAVAAASRVPESPTAYNQGAPFIDDSYDLSAYAGQANVVLRFSYFTDAGFERPGWFIDDLVVDAGGDVIYETDFTDDDPLRIFPGGCGDEGLNVAAICTVGWQRINAEEASKADHAYYLELRDRSGFDFDGNGQSDRGGITWLPGVLIEHTEESRGYGNSGYAQPPNQHYLDSQPEPGSDCSSGNCDDVAFTDDSEDSHFDDDPDDDDGDWVDNFEDGSSEDGNWHFGYGCLTLDVHSMAGDDENPDLPSNLTADATIAAGSGCLPFAYAEDDAPTDLPPRPVIQYRPRDPAPGEPVTFDGSRSRDDVTPAGELTYEWDFESDHTYDADGQVASHTFAAAGRYDVTLRVTDEAGNPSLTTTEVVVAARPDGGTTTTTGAPTSGGPTPTTGGGAPLAALLALAAAVLISRRRAAGTTTR